MPIVTLRDLYVAELQDLYDAEQLVLQVLPGMAARATSGELRAAFERHYDQTRVHIDRLDLLLRQLNERAAGATCEGIRGVVQEAHRRSAEAERGEVLDAALIAAAQRIEHYEIAAYGCARTYAGILNDADAARVLQQTLDEEGEMDRALTAVAGQGINAEAAADLTPRSTTYRSRLRYIASSDVGTFRYGSYRIVGDDGDDLGRIDGFIVDGNSGRPVYYVIDSGGWFSGRRYVLPVAQLEAEGSGASFRTELTREQLRRYPEFNASAFLAMDDQDAVRYERRLLEAVLPYDHHVRRGERPRYGELPLYQPPGWLMSGTWMADPTIVGASAVPEDVTAQRAGSDVQPGSQGGRQQPAPSASALRASTAQAGAGGAPAPHDDQTAAEHTTETEMENELMVARSEREGGRQAQQAGEEPRIEKYPDR
jgi:ferritin-like metal-binding protein YciE